MGASCFFRVPSPQEQTRMERDFIPENKTLNSLIIKWYGHGYEHMDQGHPYEAPSNLYLRSAYCLGASDWIGGTLRGDEEVLKEVLE